MSSAELLSEDWNANVDFPGNTASEVSEMPCRKNLPQVNFYGISADAGMLPELRPEV